MPGRRSRSRSPQRRRRNSHSPSTSRRRSDGDRSRYGRRNERERMVSSSDNRTRERDRPRSLSKEKDKESETGRSDLPMDSNNSHSVGNKPTTTDQENQEERKGDQPRERETGRLSSFVKKEKNVLFPSGGNTVNRGRDRVRDRSWREERGRAVGRRVQSEGIMARESVMGDRKERKQLDMFEDPTEVPRSGNFFEHDDRDAPQPSYQGRASGGFRRRERRYQRSPERRVSERGSRDVSRYRGRETWDRGPDERPRRDWGRGSVRDRLGSRSNWNDDGRRGGRDRSPMQWKHDLFQGGIHSRIGWDQQRRGGGERGRPGERVRGRPGERVRGRERSPPHWKHDLYEEEIDLRSPEPEESLEQRKLKLKMEEAAEDFNVDDILCMDNPATKMDFDV